MKGEFVDKVGLHKAITGDVDFISQVEMVDQNPIGKSSRSNPVTYIKAYDEIRDLYSKQPLSQNPGVFSQNIFHLMWMAEGAMPAKEKENRLWKCSFLADVIWFVKYVSGKRFKEEVLEVTYNDKNIHDVLEMSVDDALNFL